mgnify:CR=1 FL=1
MAYKEEGNHNANNIESGDLGDGSGEQKAEREL